LTSLIGGETLRILLVSTQESVRDEIGQALAGRAGDHRLFWVTQPELAVMRGLDLLPHLILVDDALDGASPAVLITQLVARLSGSAVVALISADGLALARQVVLAGARAFVVKPVQAEELLSALRQVLNRRQESEAAQNEDDTHAAGRILVFCAPKGGTGRTMCTVNTAIQVHRITNEPVVLVDADYASPALDVALNLSTERSIADLLPKIARLDREAVAAVLPLHASGLRVMLAPPPGDLAAPISLPQVQQVLVWLKRMFPWVLVDLGLPLDETAFAFLDGADRIVMTVLPEMIGLRNIRVMLDQLLSRGYPEEKIWLVLNRAGLPGGVPMADIEERLRMTIRHTVPDDQPLVTHSVNRGVPLAMSHSQSAVARALAGLARELTRETPVQQPVAGEKPGLAARLLSRLRTATPALRPGR
jgi:pilus assembly protein CpaE